MRFAPRLPRAALTLSSFGLRCFGAFGSLGSLRCFSFFAFGLLFGFVGLIIAIPAAAAIGVLARHAIARYRDSTIYRGKNPSQ